MHSRLELVTGSRIVHHGPCSLLALTLAANGSNADCQIYDGVNANAEQKSHLEALSGTSFHLDIEGEVMFHNGIYIATTATYGKVTVEFEPL